MANKFSLVSQSHRKQSSLPLPPVSHMDEVATLTDEDLMNQIGLLDAQRTEVLKERADSRPWDEELCYYRREAQIRRKRREIHDSFMAKQDEEIRAAKRYENSLPNADLDNSAYMLRR